jgi:hypothetical protein
MPSKGAKNSIRAKMAILLFRAPKPDAGSAVFLLGDAVHRSTLKRSGADALPLSLGSDFRLRPPPVGERGGQKAFGTGKF